MKKETNVLDTIINRISSVEQAIGKFRDALAAKEEDRVRAAAEGLAEAEYGPGTMTELKVDRIFDIIWKEMSGSKTDIISATAALKRGIRGALNEFYTQRRNDRTDTAFTADQVDINSCRQRISDLEVQLHSSIEIEKAARQEHARISEELVKVKDQHQMHILELNAACEKVIRLQQEIEDMDSLRNNVDQQIRINELETLNDGQATTILQLQRELENVTAMIENVKQVIYNDFVVGVDKWDRPNFASDDDDSDVPEMELRGS